MGRRQCSWCKRDMGPAETELDSHGICKTCKEKVEAEDRLHRLMKAVEDHRCNIWNDGPAIHPNRRLYAILDQIKKEMMADSPTLAEVNRRRGYEEEK